MERLSEQLPSPVSSINLREEELRCPLYFDSEGIMQKRWRTLEKKVETPAERRQRWFTEIDLLLVRNGLDDNQPVFMKLRNAMFVKLESVIEEGRKVKVE